MAPTNPIKQSLLYWVAADRPTNDPKNRNTDRGNLFCRVVNACDKQYSLSIDTLCVSINASGGYFLKANPEFFGKLSPSMRKLVLVHEAAHIILRHIERAYKLYAEYPDEKFRDVLRVSWNYAADFAANDSVLRLEPEMEEVTQKDADGKMEFCGLLPEAYGLPLKKTAEVYFRYILSDPHKFFDQDKECKCGEPDESDEAEGEGCDHCKPDGDGGDPAPGPESDRSDESSADGSEGGGKQPADAAGGAGDSDGDGGRDPGVDSGAGGANSKGGHIPAKAPKQPSEPKLDETTPLDQMMSKAAKEHGKLFKKMAKKMLEDSIGRHDEMWDAAERLTPEQAMAMGNKIKRGARIMVGRIVDATRKSRGFIPGGIEQYLTNLLAEDVVPWHSILADVLGQSVGGRIRDSITTPNLSLIEDMSIEPYPGQTLDPEFVIGWLMDTSGSVAMDEYSKGVAVLNSLMKVDANVKCWYIEIDARIQFEELTNNVHDEPKTSRSRHGFGGTVFVSAFRRFCGVDTDEDRDTGAVLLPERPHRIDLLVVCTDGGVGILGECFPRYHPGVPIVWLITQHGRPAPGMDNAAPDRVIQMFDTPDLKD